MLALTPEDAFFVGRRSPLAAVRWWRCGACSKLRRMNTHAAWGVLSTASLAVFLAACSDTVTPADGGARDAPRDDGVVDAPPSSPCPTTEPSEGAPCARDALECEYGSDPRRECRALAACSGATWHIQRLSADGAAPPWCASVPPATCPATLDAASGQRCSAQGAVCTYGGLVCECTNCRAFPVGGCFGDPAWQCDRQPPAAGCPSASPRIGDVCAREGLDCLYGCNSPNGAVACRGGVWQRGSFNNCPISTRRAKRDIEYLSPAEADALAAQVRATRLATYEYTIPSMAGRRRLGFILEDQPQSFAADPERSQVDLYGYTSLLVAAVQSQGRQIEALQREVEDLRRRLPRAPGAAPRRSHPAR